MAASGGVLSGSTDGKLIKITGTDAGSANTLHTAGPGTTGTWDELWVWCYNADTSDRILTILWGGTTSDDLVPFTVPAGAVRLVMQGPARLCNSLVAKAYADVANKLYAYGAFNRMS